MEQLKRGQGLRVAGAGLVCWDELEGGEGQAGGTCGNVLANLAYLGAKTTLYDRLDRSVGTGQLILADLEGMEVGLKYARLFPEDNAPKLHRWLGQKGRKEGYAWESKQIELESIQIIGLDGKLPAARVFFFDRSNPATLMLARHYALSGASIYFEPQGRQGDLKGALAVAHIVQFSADYFPNQAWIAPQAQLEIRTEGRNGLYYRLGSKVGHLRAYPTTVVDSAGAGDWLSAGLIVALHEEEFAGLEKASKLEADLKYAQALAALNCQHTGARGMVYDLSREEIARRLSELRSSNGKAKMAAAIA